jgi:2-polyprenyl-6-methoxyphenol hydroxylase-like FAD-dependent oxidoreductase
MSEENAAEVLIVGAGPTGLSLAITLRRYGIPVRIIDRNAEPSSVSKALALWSASLEALQGMGVVDHFVAEGQRLNALCVGEGDRRPGHPGGRRRHRQRLSLSPAAAAVAHRSIVDRAPRRTRCRH